ncbi:MAG TPA: hypothetical protein VFS20_22000, partial [Longimicrobium sp.]|nr:hypothetical protein [Longimicrobium sp.]
MLLGSETLYRLILHFILNPDEAPHFRSLQRRVGGGVRPLKAALDRLEEQGLVSAGDDANRRVYRVNEAHPGWDAL